MRGYLTIHKQPNVANDIHQDVSFCLVYLLNNVVHSSWGLNWFDMDVKLCDVLIYILRL